MFEVYKEEELIETTTSREEAEYVISEEIAINNGYKFLYEIVERKL